MGDFAEPSKMCQCCIDNPCGSKKCGCMGCSTFRIRGVILLVFTMAIDLYLFSFFAESIASAKCGSGDSDMLVVYNMHGPLCYPNQAAPIQQFGWWNDKLRESSDYADASDAIDLSLLLVVVAMCFNGIVTAIAFYELLGFTLGSRCQAFTVSFLGLLQFLFLLVAAILPYTSKMLGDKPFTASTCALCGFVSTDAKEASANDGLNNLWMAAFFSIASIVCGIMMFVQAKNDVKFVNLPSGADASSTVL